MNVVKMQHFIDKILPVLAPQLVIYYKLVVKNRFVDNKHVATGSRMIMEI